MNKNSYHHGGLKKMMIQKGLYLLNKNGSISLRKLASLCGVSHAAPYRHFKNKDELVAAITDTISTEFKESVLTAVNTHAEPKAQLIELCKQYVSFMVQNPDYYRYIFMTPHATSLNLQQDIYSSHPFSIARECAKAFFESIGIDWHEKFLALWCQIHGLTLLLVNKTIQFEGDYAALAQRMVESFIKSAEKS